MSDTGLPVAAASDEAMALAEEPVEAEADLEIDEDFLRRIREV
jgi:hypothetical protein